MKKFLLGIVILLLWLPNTRASTDPVESITYQKDKVSTKPVYKPFYMNCGISGLAQTVWIAATTVYIIAHGGFGISVDTDYCNNYNDGGTCVQICTRITYGMVPFSP